jgi:hypothetical protein
MAISRFSSSRVTQGLPKYQSAWDNDTAQGAMEPIGSVLCDGTTPTISFQNIPQHYQDLMLVVNGRSSFTGSFTTYSVYLNNAIFGLTSYTNIVGDGTTVSSNRVANGAFGASIYFPGVSSAIGNFSPSITHILDYKSSNNKLMISKFGTDVSAGGGYIGYQATLYRDTSPIVRVDASTNGVMVAGSRVTLYGIKGGN